MLAPFVATLVTTILCCFYASLACPATTSAIVHALLWPLALSGLLLIVQALGACAYHFAAERLSVERKEAVAWLCALGSAGPVAMIALISSFMTTPGSWLETLNIWDAVFNPTFIPALILHAAWGIALAGAAMLVVVNSPMQRLQPEAVRLERLSALTLWALVAAAPIAILYLMMLGKVYTTLAFSAHTTLIYFIGGLIATAMALAILFITAGVRRERIGFSGSLALLALLFIATGAFNLAQAGIRKPYTIAGYLYTNDIAVSEMQRLHREGVLPHANWIVPPGIDLRLVTREKRGEWVYAAMNYARYPATSLDNFRLRLAGLDRVAARTLITHLELLNPQIPPFAGSPEEVDDLAAYLQSRGEEGQR